MVQENKEETKMTLWMVEVKNVEFAFGQWGKASVPIVRVDEMNGAPVPNSRPKLL